MLHQRPRSNPSLLEHNAVFFSTHSSMKTLCFSIMPLTPTPFAMFCGVAFLSFAYVNYICLCVTTRFAYTKVAFLKHRSRIQFHSIAYVNYICICATARFASTKLPCHFDQLHSKACANYICKCATTRFAYTKLPFLNHLTRNYNFWSLIPCHFTFAKTICKFICCVHFFTVCYVFYFFASHLLNFTNYITSLL